MLHILTTVTRYGMFCILLESSSYTLSNDVIEKLTFLMFLTAMGTELDLKVACLNYIFTRFCLVIFSHHDTWILCCIIKSHML